MAGMGIRSSGHLKKNGDGILRKIAFLLPKNQKKKIATGIFMHKVDNDRLDLICEKIVLFPRIKGLILVAVAN